MQDNRKKIIIIGGIILLLVLIFILWWIFFHKPTAPAVPANTATTSTSQILIKSQLQQLPPPTSQVATSEQNYPLALKQLAFSFAERYGSYSNQSNFKGLDDLRPLSTIKMQKYIDGLIAKGTASAMVYDGYNTKALNSDLLQFSAGAGTAQVLVKTQRFHFVGSNAPVVSYQNLLLTFAKSGDQWLVDSAQWQ